MRVMTVSFKKYSHLKIDPPFPSATQTSVSCKCTQMPPRDTEEKSEQVKKEKQKKRRQKSIVDIDRRTTIYKR